MNCIFDVIRTNHYVFVKYKPVLIATIDYVNEVVDEMYVAGNGIVIEDREVRLDDLILDCGTSTTNI